MVGIREILLQFPKPLDSLEHRQHHRTLSDAHFGAQESGADERHVRRRALVYPDREDIDDGDDDDDDNEERQPEFDHFRPPVRRPWAA